VHIYQPIRDGQQYDPNPKHYVILSPISDWLIYVLCVPRILGGKYWLAGPLLAKNQRYTSGPNPNPRTGLRNQTRRLTSFGPGHWTTRKSRSRSKTRDVTQFGWCRWTTRENLGRPPDVAERMNRSTKQNPLQSDSVAGARFLHLANRQSASRLASQPALLVLVGVSCYPWTVAEQTDIKSGVCVCRFHDTGPCFAIRNFYGV